MMAGELDGRVALVTGAAGGIGRATALMMAAMGADTVLLDLKSEELEDTRGAIAKTGRRAHAINMDVRERDAVKAAIGKAEAGLGRIDIVVNNAGVGLAGPGALEKIEDTDLDRMFGVHVMGAFAVTQAVVPGMKARGWGRIVNIASNRGQVGFTDGSHYSGAKGALIAMAKSWAKELAPWGILVNAIAPGVVRTPMTEAHGMDAIVEEAGWNLMNRWAEPEEIAASVAFLVNGAGAYYTGQLLCPNGGDPIVGI
jgi:NAD(P)-dependent dehydrogenase (short-subunit alcohol dehydrogenase family)